MPDKLRMLLTRILLCFALLSVIVSVVKIVTRRDTGRAAPSGTKLVVYYMHASFRCETCNTIEKMAHDFLSSKYADKLADGTMEWVTVDYMTDTALAAQFDVVSGCVVVARVENGTVKEFRRLDEVWTLMSDVDAFNQYLDAAVVGLEEKQ